MTEEADKPSYFYGNLMSRNYLTGFTRSLVRAFSIPAPTPWDYLSPVSGISDQRSIKQCTLDPHGKESDYCDTCPHLRRIKEKKLKNVSEEKKPREDNLRRGLVPED